MITENITEFDIEALVDSQLDWEREKKVWSVLAHNQMLYEHYKGLVAQKKLLRSWWSAMMTGAEDAKPS